MATLLESAISRFPAFPGLETIWVANLLPEILSLSFIRHSRKIINENIPWLVASEECAQMARKLFA